MKCTERKKKTMEVSRLTVNPQLFETGRLKGKRKTTLRRKLIVDYINEKPSGEIIAMAEFQKTAQISTSANTHTFVQRMIRDGIRYRYKGDKPMTYYYAVPGGIKTRKLESAVTPVPAGVSTLAPQTELYPEILKLAKDFAWEKNEDSLRAFVDYVKSLKV